MDLKPIRSKYHLSYHQARFSEKFPEISSDYSLSHKNSISINTPISLKKISQNLSTGKLPNPSFPSKYFQANSNVSSVKRFSTKHFNSIQSTPKSRILSKEKLFSSADSIPTTLNPQTVLSYFKHELTEYEKMEIVKYDDIYFFSKLSNKIKQKEGYNDERGDYVYKIGDHIAYRYEILKLLGKGNFGQVILCQDYKRNEKVAVKIVRNKKRFTKQAAVEVKVLQALKENDLDGKKSVVKIKTFFVFRKHVCMVFEEMAMNLFELLQQNHFEGFSLGIIKKFTSQILNCLDLTYKLGIVHCDLKPENVMLVSTKSTAIRVIDFGTSCFEQEKIYTYIQSRFYRAPEIILGIPYTVAIDMWSLGCIVAEFFTGYPLFTGDTEHEQLGFFIQVLGTPPSYILKVSTKARNYFDKNTFIHPPNSQQTEPKPLNQILSGAPEDLQDFVTKCLDWDPSSRLRPMEALKHPFIHKPKTKKKKLKSKRTSQVN